MVANFSEEEAMASYKTRYRHYEPAETDGSCIRVRARRSPIRRHLIDTANPLAIVLFALGRLGDDESEAAQNPRDQRTRTRRQIDRVNRTEKDKGREEAQHTRRTLDCPG
jgi:type VI protein secretion system component VasF